MQVKKREPMTTEEKEESAIYGEFIETIHNQMTDDQFWNWVREWMDVDEIMDAVREWDKEDQKEVIENWKAGKYNN